MHWPAVEGWCLTLMRGQATHELTLPRTPCTGSYDGPILRYSSNLEEIAPVKASQAAEAGTSKVNAPPPSHAKPNPLFITSSGVSSLPGDVHAALHPALAWQLAMTLLPQSCNGSLSGVTAL